MRRRTVLIAAAGSGAATLLPMLAGTDAKAAPVVPVLDTLAVSVARDENRHYSFTDKVSAYFHARTHADQSVDWFNGWNIATKRIFQDYRLTMDEQPLVRAQSSVGVSPHELVRDFGIARETFRMFDGVPALMVEVTAERGAFIGLNLVGDLTGPGVASPDGVWFRPKEDTARWLLLAPIRPTSILIGGVDGLATEMTAQGFFLICETSKAKALRVLADLRRNHIKMTAQRMARMEALISGPLALDAGDPDRTKALLWMRLTADQLVMKQMGTGIYAGLPWFNDYWGRDTFISITGTLFVTGQYDVAADVFRSFAALQDTDPQSKTYGRIPNRARPDGVQYNTADGTPRFIITLASLIERTGNFVLAEDMWPAVKRAITGLLSHDLDDSGLVTHGDADTWMDAKEKGVRAFSPRGNRAIDIQALWIEALEAAIILMIVTKDVEFGQRVVAALNVLRQSLAAYFVDKATGKLVDHLRPDGSADLAIRPNAFFALNALEQQGQKSQTDALALEKQKMIWARHLWQGLVYPWGVATLSQDDPEFHPYHEHWHYYHKDAAYHNGTVWPWLNGVAMTTLLRLGVQKQPWQLFENMNRQALHEGAVGSLAECADALPVPGATWARRTGTFLQAWSNAEHLRVWHEEILGVRVRGAGTIIDIYPQLPANVLNVQMNTQLKKGVLLGYWHRGNAHTWAFELQGADAEITFAKDASGPNWVSWPLKSGERLEIIEEGSRLTLTAYDGQNRVLGSKMSGLDALVDGPTTLFEESVEEEKAFKALRNEIFKDLGFCEPKLAANLKSLSVFHDPQLEY